MMEVARTRKMEASWDVIEIATEKLVGNIAISKRELFSQT